jgi:hypothetical protein
MESLDRRLLCPDASWVRIIDQTCSYSEHVFLEQGGANVASEFKFVQQFDEANDCKYWKIMGVLGQCADYTLDFDPEGKDVQMDIDPFSFRFEVDGLPDEHEFFESKPYCEFE